MVIYNTPTKLSGCSFCGDDDVAPVLPPDENEYAIGTDPSKEQLAPKTSFDLQVEQVLKPLPSWMIGVGIGVVALGVVAGVYAVSRNV